MKPRTDSRPQARRAGFTLAEVLAALAFMAIVIPVAVHGLQIANRAGVVAQRKSMAAGIGERVINEIVVARAWTQTTRSGTQNAGPYRFTWTIHNQPWNALTSVQSSTSVTGVNTGVVTANNIHELSVDVSFDVQGQAYSVHLSTLVDTTLQALQSVNPQL